MNTAIIGITDSKGDIQGPIQKGGLTDDTRPTVHGTAMPGSTVTVYHNGVILGTAPVNAQGQWSFTPVDALPEGEQRLTASATDGAGNVGPQTGEYPIVIDTTPPQNLGQNQLIDDVGPSKGVIVSGGKTDDASPTFSGKTEPHAEVIVRDNGKEIGRVQADKDGNWAFTPEKPLDDGPHSFTSQPVDAAGLAGSESAATDFNLETSRVRVTIVSVEAEAGDFVQKNGLTNDTTPTINGTAVPNEAINIYDKGVLIGSTRSDDKGNWSFTPAQGNGLEEGQHRFTATVTDPLIGESAMTAPFDLVIDLTAPVNGGIDTVLDDVGAIQDPVKNGGATDDSTPTLVGKGTPGDVVTVIANGDTQGSVTVGDNGEWSFTPLTPLPDGSYEFTTVITDPAGNVSDPSDPYVVIVDTTAPEKPAIGEVDDNVGPITGPVENGGSTDDTKPAIGGVGTPGDVVTIIDNGKEIGSTVVGDDGEWTFTPTDPLPEGENSLVVVVTDPIGNVSDPSDPYIVIVDTQAPNVPAITSLFDDVGVTGDIPNGGITDDPRPTLNGTAEANSVVNVYQDDVLIGSTLADAQGKWDFTPVADLSDDTHEFAVTATDAAGNVSAKTPAWVVTVDTSVKVLAPVITSVEDDVGSLTGDVANNGVTDDKRPTLHGTADANNIIKVYIDGVEKGSTTANAQGEWSFTPPDDLPDAVHTFYATATDTTGTSVPSNSWSLTVDTVAPNAPVITSVVDDVGLVTGDIANGGTTDDKRPVINGTAEANSTVAVYLDGNYLGSTQVNASGMWSFVTTQDLSSALHHITAKATDAAGNISDESNNWDIIVDVPLPAAPVITGLTDDFGAKTGPIPNGGRTDDQTPEVVGTAIPNSVVHIYNGNALLASVTADASGKWTWDGLSNGQPLPLGSYSLNATSTVGGDTSAKSASWGVTIGPDGAKNSENFDWWTNAYIIEHGLNYSTTFGAGTKLLSGMRFDTNITIKVAEDGFPSSCIKVSGAGKDDEKKIGIEEGTPDIHFRMGFTANLKTIIGYVYFYDTNGALISKVNVPIADRTIQKVDFTAPAGRLIGSVGFKYSDNTPMYADDFEWGRTIPASNTQGLNVIADDVIVADESAVVDKATDIPGENSADQSETGQQAGSENHGDAPEETQEKPEAKSDAESGAKPEAEGVTDAANPATGTAKASAAEVVAETVDDAKAQHILVVDHESGVMQLSLNNVLESGAEGLFVDDASQQLLIRGEVGDKIELSDLLKDGTDTGDWKQVAGTVTVAGEKYEVYQHSGADVELLVQQGVQVDLLNH
jgi:hypothetical protein